jgi:hypothetical protein
MLSMVMGLALTSCELISGGKKENGATIIVKNNSDYSIGASVAGELETTQLDKYQESVFSFESGGDYGIKTQIGIIPVKLGDRETLTLEWSGGKWILYRGDVVIGEWSRN